MDARAYLERVRKLDQVIRIKGDQLEHLRSLSERCTGHLSGMPRGTVKRDYSDIVDELILAEQAFKIEIEQCLYMRRNVRQAISRMEDDRYRQLLELRYLSGYTWQSIAIAMHYDVRWIYQLHIEALQKIRFDDA